MKKIICLLASLLLFTQSVYAKTADYYTQRFWDVEKNHWAFLYIADLADRGVINGYEDGSFKPNRTVSRAEWAKMMIDAAGVNFSDNQIYFTDMTNHWANNYVNAAKNYLTGFSDGSYRPDQAATREDVTVAMVKLKGYDLSEVDYSYLSNFTDTVSISNYAKGYVAVAVQNDLISGFEDNTFRGQDTLTRAEAATLLYRAFQHGNADKVVTAPTEPIAAEPSKQAISESINQSETENEYIQQAQSTRENPDEQENIKSYKVETLAKLNDSHNAIYDTGFSTLLDDCIYYIDENNLYQVNTISGESNIRISEGDSVLYQNENYEVTGIIKVFSDQIDGRVLASCNIYHPNDFSVASGETVLIDVSNNEIVSDKNYCTAETDYPVIYVDNGELWTQYRGSYYIDKGLSTDINDLDERWYFGEDIELIFNCMEKNGKFYLSSETGVYAYDFNDLKQIVDCKYTPIGCNENGFYIKSVNNSLVHVDFSGKKDQEISLDDIEIKDRKPIHLEAYKMYINSNDEIIFYDISSSSFRKISKN